MPKSPRRGRSADAGPRVLADSPRGRSAVHLFHAGGGGDAAEIEHVPRGRQPHGRLFLLALQRLSLSGQLAATIRRPALVAVAARLSRRSAWQYLADRPALFLC